MKKTLISVLTVLLVLSLVVSSAFAFNLSYQKVSLPDPYGIMPLSLDEDRGYTLFTSAPITYGANNLASVRKTYASQSKNSALNGVVLDSFSYALSLVGAYISVPSGFYADVTAPVSIDNSTYSSVVLGGNALLAIGTYFFTSGSSVATSVYIYPSYAQVLINGLPVGDVVSILNGTFTFPDIEVELTSPVTSLGIRFTYGTNLSNSISSGSNSDKTYFLTTTFTDGFSYTPVEGDDDYIPFFERIVAWLTSIASSVSPINSTLERIEAILGSSNDENSPISRLANVFARDDDIQLRDDVDPVLQEVTDVFFDIESNPTTAISADKITTVGESIKGVDSMFQSGYDATDAFQDIADNQDDYLAWFSTDTAAWLDTVNTASTVDDSDPFNMWRVQEQYNEIEERRGKD